MIIPAVVILVVVLKGVSSSVQVSRKVLLRDGVALLICEFILIFLIGGQTLYWYHGAILMTLYGIYVAFMLSTMKSKSPAEDDGEEEEEDDDSESQKSIIYNLLTLDLEPIFVKNKINNRSAWSLLLIAMLVIGIACLVLVKSCEWLGESLNIPIYFIAVIIASAATSVPDTILSMKDAQNGNYDDAVSNALGSNIFDICFALGLPLFVFTALYGPITMSAATIANVTELWILLLGLTFVAFVIYIIRRNLTLIQALLLLSIYVVFTMYIFGRSMDVEWANTIHQILADINAWIDLYRL